MYQFRSSIYYEPSDSGSVKSVQVGNAKQDQVRYLTDQLQAVIMFNEKLEKEINTLKQQNQQLKQSVVDKDRLISEAQESSSKTISKLHVLLSENKKLQEIVISTNKNLKTSNSKVQQLQQENNVLKQTMQQQEEYHVEEMKKRANELEQHYQLMQNIVSDLTSQVSQLCEEKQRLQNELDEKNKLQQK
ncbi:unnamed protein product (macronuclear) [Paramecium tetraurelia]|uniref:Uncharacterized protein n=1 Tax=Paramecium tetraurelia TaxID=5888 RepID=A0BUL9_PARTE|nr:uncharacterized protein GSPATT00005482001 [Paramecium tetraurelia]CAK62236.1 unnamed protein product [Paramecium tetraurelia]|eukprot:XP_001429634.1 hypothetical protein (macronuclear) [Paramecium tetraurelia strain d4-2]